MEHKQHIFLISLLSFLLLLQDLLLIGKVKNIVVAVKKLGRGVVDIANKNVRSELNMMRNIHHENINPFIGLCLNQTYPCYLMAYCSRGSLNDVLLNGSVDLTLDFKLCLLTDIARGMKYLHNSEIGEGLYPF